MTNSYNKTQTDALISQIYFWHKTLHVSDSSSVHHQEFLTVHKAVVYDIQSSLLVLPASCQQTCMTYTVAVRTVKYSWWWTGELFETCSFMPKNKFEKLVQLVGFITRITGISTYETETSSACDFPNNRLFPSCSDCKKVEDISDTKERPTNRDIRTPYTSIRTNQYVYTYVTNKQMPSVSYSLKHRSVTYKKPVCTRKR